MTHGFLKKEEESNSRKKKISESTKGLRTDTDTK
jgi:hypothetical protein